MGAIARRN
jgi:hypothetical protein